METRISQGGVGRWIVTVFAVAASCTSFEKSDQEPNALVESSGGRAVGVFTGGAGGASTGGARASGGVVGSGGRSCGNGRVETPEQCDTFNVGNETCATATSHSMPSGTLLCSTNCTFDISMCSASGGGGFGGITGFGGRAGTTGFDGSTCVPFGASCSSAACCGNLACFGTCCHPLGASCTNDGDCCPFDQCRPQGFGGQANRCCHAYGVSCQSHGDCCSGYCTESGAAGATGYCSGSDGGVLDASAG
jgi:hypothetical protein